MGTPGNLRFYNCEEGGDGSHQRWGTARLNRPYSPHRKPSVIYRVLSRAGESDFLLQMGCPRPGLWFSSSDKGL